MNPILLAMLFDLRFWCLPWVGMRPAKQAKPDAQPEA